MFRLASGTTTALVAGHNQARKIKISAMIDGRRRNSARLAPQRAERHRDRAAYPLLVAARLTSLIARKA